MEKHQGITTSAKKKNMPIVIAIITIAKIIILVRFFIYNTSLEFL